MASNSNVRTNDPTKVPALPRIPADTPPSLRRYLELLEQTTNIRLGRRGDPRDRAVTLRELIDSGLATELAQKPFDSNRGGDPGFVSPGSKLPDLAVPPAPTGFSATGAYSTIIIAFAFPSYSNHSHTEIWSHSSDSIGDATLVGIQTGRVFTDPVGSGVTRYYWARHVNTDSVVGPFNAAAGTQAQTATDVAHQLNVLSNAITSSQLATSLSEPIAKIPGIESFTGYTSGYSGNSLLTRIGAVETTAGNAATSAQLSVESTARANADSALASDITSLTTTVGNNTTSISTNATSINGVEAQYTVKIDSNGHVSGFGLASTTTTAGPTSAFIVRADKFAIIDPSNTGSGLGTTSPSSSIVPFIIDSGNTYIASAMIKDASIVSAKINSLAVDKLSGTMATFGTTVTGTLAANKIALDGSTIEAAIIGGVSTVQIKNLGVGDAKISSLNASKLTAGSLTVYNAADSNTMGKLFSVTSGYVATTAYNTNSTTNMSYASAVSDWTGSGPYHYNPSTSLNMPAMLINGATSGNSFVIPDVEGNQTHVEVTIMFGCHPIGIFNGDESSFCTVHLQTSSSLANTGSYSTNSMVFDGTTFVEGSTFASVPLTGVHTVSLNPGTWYVWLFAWSRKADLPSGGSHGFSDGYVHVNSFYK